MTMQPFFSVIVVSFNAGAKLKQTLDSILTQTFGDYEVIIKDGASTDGSLSLVPADPRIRLLVGKDAGIYDAMNQALRQARGEVFYFLNCGDVLHERTTLAKVAGRIRGEENLQAADSARRHPEEAEGWGTDAGIQNRKIPAQGTIYYGSVIEMQTGQEVVANPTMSHFAMYRYLPCHQACFYTRDLFGERQFDATYKVRADYEHFLWSVIRHGAGTVFMPLVVANYEGGGYSETAQGRKRSAAEHKEITQKYFSRKERFLYRLYLVCTLQPLREKIAQGKYTAALYDKVKNAIYRHKAQQ